MTAQKNFTTEEIDSYPTATSMAIYMVAGSRDINLHRSSLGKQLKAVWKRNEDEQTLFFDHPLEKLTTN